jgi:hypothetical protein
MKKSIYLKLKKYNNHTILLFLYMLNLAAMLHEYGYGYPIQYVSETQIHTFSKENPLKWCS